MTQFTSNTRYAVPSSNLGSPMLQVPDAPLDGLGRAGQAIAAGLSDLAQAQHKINQAQLLKTEQEYTNQARVEFAKAFEASLQDDPVLADQNFQAALLPFMDRVESLENPQLREGLRGKLQTEMELTRIRVRAEANQRLTESLRAGQVQSDQIAATLVSKGQLSDEDAIARREDEIMRAMPWLGELQTEAQLNASKDAIVNARYAYFIEREDYEGAEKYLDSELARFTLAPLEIQKRKDGLQTEKHNKAVKDIQTTYQFTNELLDQLFAAGIPRAEELQYIVQARSEEIRTLSKSIKGHPPKSLNDIAIELLQPQLNAAVIGRNEEAFKLIASQLPTGAVATELIAKGKASLDNAIQSQSTSLSATYKERATDMLDVTSLDALEATALEDSRLTDDDKQTTALHIRKQKNELAKDGNNTQHTADVVMTDLARGSFTPTTKQADAAWGQLISQHDPAVVAQRFVKKGFLLPPEGISYIKTAAAQRPDEAFRVLRAIQSVEPDVAREIGTQIGHDGRFALAVSVSQGMDDAGALGVQAVMMHEKAPVHLATANKIWGSKEFEPSAAVMRGLGVKDAIISDNDIAYFKDRYFYRYVESAILGFTQDDAQARAEREAANDIPNAATRMELPVSEGSWGSNVKKTVLLPHALFGLGTNAAPNQKARAAFIQALDSTVDNLESDTDRIAIEMRFGRDGKAYIPMLGDGDVIGFMEWTPTADKEGVYAHSVIRQSDSRFDSLEQKLLTKETPANLHPLASFARKPEYEATSMEEHNPAWSKSLVDYMRQEWLKLHSPPVTPEEKQMFADAVNNMAVTLGWHSHRPTTSGANK